MESSGDREPRWHFLLAGVPLVALLLGVSILLWVGRYPHHDLGATYAEGFGWAIVLAGGWFLLMMLRRSIRVAIAAISVIPLLLGVGGLLVMAELTGM